MGQFWINKKIWIDSQVLLNPGPDAFETWAKVRVHSKPNRSQTQESDCESNSRIKFQ